MQRRRSNDDPVYAGVLKRAVFAAAAALAVSGSAAAEAPACALLERSEAEAVVGTPLKIDEGAEKKGYSDCAWIRSGKVVGLLYWTPEAFTGGKVTAEERYAARAGALSRKNGLASEPEGIAEKARLLDESSPGIIAYTIVVLQNGAVAELSARGVTKADTLDLLRTAVGRIPALEVASAEPEQTPAPAPAEAQPPASQPAEPQPPPAPATPPGVQPEPAAPSETPPESAPPPPAETQPEQPTEPTPEAQPEAGPPPPAETQPEPAPPPPAEAQPAPTPPAEAQPEPAPQPPAEAQPEPLAPAPEPAPVSEPPVVPPSPPAEAPTQPPEEQPPVVPPSPPAEAPTQPPEDQPPVVEPEPQPAPEALPPAPEPAPPPKPPARTARGGSPACKLLAKADFRKLTDGEVAMNDPGPGGQGESSCSWRARQAAFYVRASLLEREAIPPGQDADAYFGELEAAATEGGAQLVAGVGDRAVLETSGEGDEAMRSISILSDGRIVFLNLTSVGEADALNLARAAAGRM